MSLPEFSFQSHQLYIDQQAQRLRSHVLHEGEIYTALSRLDATHDEEALSFPVQLESFSMPNEFLHRRRMAQFAMKIIFLDQDLHRSGIPLLNATVQDGVWELDTPLHTKWGKQPIKSGYFVLSLPDDPNLDELRHNNDNQDPRSR